MAKLASIIASAVALVGGMFNQPSVMQSAPPQAAMVQNIVAPAIQEIQTIAQNLLPSVKVKMVAPVAASTSTAQPAAQLSAQTSPSTTGRTPHVSTTTRPTPSLTSIATSSAPAPLSTEAFLKATVVTPIERRDGPFEIQFGTALGSGQSDTWDLTDATVGGGQEPMFAISYTCDPAPIPAPVGAQDQNPTFTSRTPYSCTVSLTPQSGSDLRAQTKQFSFTIPAGQLIVTAPPSMSTVLKNDLDNGGFVFNNEDTASTTITQLTVDVSYTALSTLYGPLILRVVDPATGQPAGDFHLENLPAVTGQQFTFAQSGMAIPVSFTLPPGAVKLLPLQLLGVHTMSVLGTNPVATITLRSIATNRADSNAVMNSASLSWNCVVTTASYDPNATSGPLVAGDACNVGGN